MTHPSVNDRGPARNLTKQQDNPQMHGLQFFLTRSVWMLSATALTLLVFSLGLLVYSAWRHVERIEPLQQHLRYLKTVEIAEGEVRAQVINLLASEDEVLDFGSFEALHGQLNALRASEDHLVESTPGVIDHALKQLVQFDGKSRHLLDGASHSLRGALNQELAAHESLANTIEAQAQRRLRIAIGLALGLLMVSVLLWAMVRRRILTPLQTLAGQMTLLARHDYSELPVERTDPLLFPMIENYNHMARRLRRLEQLQQQRQKTLTDEVRSATHMLLQQQGRLAQTERLGAVGEIAAEIAHELRNPLTSIQMALENLRYDVQGAELAQRVDLITDEVKRITHQLNQLLDQARQRPEVLVRVDIGAELDNLVALTSYQLPQQVSVRYETDKQLTCLLPRSRLRQVLLNLILNAGQAIGEKAGEIALQAWREDDRLNITVTDTGPGFPPEMLKAGVRPFHSRRAGGTGLGLVMVRRFSGDLGGELLLSNCDAGGARVTLSLPWKQADGQDPADHRR